MKKLYLTLLSGIFCASISSESEAAERFAVDKVLMTKKCAGAYTTCDLKNADFRGRDMGGMHAPNAKMQGFQGQHGNFKNANFRGADLGFANFAGADLSGADLRDTNMHHVDLTGANLEGARFTKTSKRQATLYHADARDANFKNAKMSRTRLTGMDARDANFKYANVKRSVQDGANFRGANLDQVDEHQIHAPQDVLFDNSAKRPHVPVHVKMVHEHQIKKQ